MSPRIVQARLDKETDELLRQARVRSGLTDSELVRRGLRLLVTQLAQGPAPRVIGLGRFASKHSDLGSNKAHLRGLGRK